MTQDKKVSIYYDSIMITYWNAVSRRRLLKYLVTQMYGDAGNIFLTEFISNVIYTKGI